jgi:hypothetical protein
MKKSSIALGVAAALSGGTAAAAGAGDLSLAFINTGSSNGPSAAWSLTSGAWSTDGAGTITDDGSQTTAKFRINPISNLFTHQFSGMTLGGGTHSTTAYECIEGNFGGNVGASLCGNYNFGANFLNESSVNYNTVPGTRTDGGDDGVIGPMQQASDYGCTVVQNDSFVSGNVICQTASWTASPGSAGIQMVFHRESIVPVPAAVWLFGSALGLLGWARRRA